MALKRDNIGPSDEEALSILCNSHRRELLWLLGDEEVVSVEYAAEVINSVKPPTIVEQLLHHTHIPKMVEFGIVEYDYQSKKVEKGENFSNAYNALKLLTQLP